MLVKTLVHYNYTIYGHLVSDADRFTSFQLQLANVTSGLSEHLKD